MARVSLRAHVDDAFINRLVAITSSGGNAGANVAKAISGQASQTSMPDALRLGARTYATSVQALNLGISFVNLADNDLSQLSGIADRVVEIAEAGQKSSLNKQERRRLTYEFYQLGRDFDKIIENAEFAGREYLDKTVLESVFVEIGLDPSKSSDTSKLFKDFIADGDGKLASEHVGSSQYELPAESDTEEITRGSLFGFDKSIRTTKDAKELYNSALKLKQQLDTNVETLEGARDMLGKNLLLVRAVGYALLDLSEEINTTAEADEVAHKLRRMIRSDARGALAQAENLDPLAVAALTFDSSSFS